MKEARPLQNKEGKPKSNQKAVRHNPGVIGTPTMSQARRPKLGIKSCYVARC
ncbi:unnamed protein product [Arabis nemorensis]|uniref:Uncharacterized protein n=1 Tax=Arabis nemorensis TaxID=586526 RepID=A0A565B7C8_9BRAS|nr:unnamed protein product [Arabis nemorensis]